MALVTVAEALAAIGRWSDADQRMWRDLAEVDPKNAEMMAEAAVLLDARPIDLDGSMPLNPRSLADRPRPGSLRLAPPEARDLLARLTHPDEENADAA